MTSRRNFMSTTAAVTAAGATGAAVAQSNAPIKMVMQSAFPKTEMFHSFAQLYADKVAAMSGGRLEITVIPAGKDQKSKPFDVIDAVSSGTVDAGMAFPSYWTDKAAAAGMWESGPAWGMSADMLLAWHKYGGGAALLDEIYRGIGADVKSCVCMPMPTQPLGWFKNPVSSPNDFKNLRYRTVGLAVKIFEKMGAKVLAIPGGQLLDAIKANKLDAAEFNNTTSDNQLGLNTVANICMLQSFHQSAGLMEVILSNKFLAKIPADLQKILEFAAEAVSSDGALRQIKLNAQSYEALSRNGVQFMKTPSVILQAQLNAWDEVIAELSAKDAMVAKVVNSQREYADLVVPWKQDIEVDFRIAYDHYWTRRV